MEPMVLNAVSDDSSAELSTLPLMAAGGKKAADDTQLYFSSNISDDHCSDDTGSVETGSVETNDQMEEDMDFTKTNASSKKEQHHEIDESKPCPYDVVCGRDKFSHAHVGNKRFRSLIEMYRERYQTAPSRDDKTRITCKIVAMIRAFRPGGRFLKLDPETKEWYDVGDEYAREKVSHALRSAKDPALRKPRRKRKPSTAPRKKPVHSPVANRVFQQLLSDQQRIFDDLLREDKLNRQKDDAAKGKR